MIERIPDWPSALAAFMESRERMPFAWGRNDCVLFAADAVVAMTGHDLATPSNRCYRSARGAAGVLKRLGHGGVAALAGARFPALGWPSVAVSYAQRGDIGVAPMGGRDSLLVRVSGWWVGPGLTGVAHIRTVTKAWAVAR